MQVIFEDGSKTDVVQVDYPVGHARRREEGLPLLLDKLESNLKSVFPASKTSHLLGLFRSPPELMELEIRQLMDLLSAP